MLEIEIDLVSLSEITILTAHPVVPDQIVATVLLELVATFRDRGPGQE